MTTLATVGYDLQAAMETALTAATAGAAGGILVDWGYPDPYGAVDAILIMGVETDQDNVTLGTNRSREETLMLELRFWCFRPTQKAAASGAFDNLKLIERYCRLTMSPDVPGSPFSGICRDIYLASYKTYTSDPDDLSAGRGTEIVATFKAQARVSA